MDNHLPTKFLSKCLPLVLETRFCLHFLCCIHFLHGDDKIYSYSQLRFFIEIPPTQPKTSDSVLQCNIYHFSMRRKIIEFCLHLSNRFLTCTEIVIFISTGNYSCRMEKWYTRARPTLSFESRSPPPPEIPPETSKNNFVCQ